MTLGGMLAKLRKENHYTQEQMQELLIHKANAACLLGLNEQNRQIMYNKLRKFRNRRIENSPQNKGQGQRHLVE